jgi:hypothetical protein
MKWILLLLFIPMVVSLKSNCYKCIWAKPVFPQKRYCIYYQEYIISEFDNCTKYKLKDLDW